MCHPIPVQRFFQQAIPNNCTAKSLGASERLTIGVQAVAGHSITDLADEHDVSRKFVYQQAAVAETALLDAFTQAKQAKDNEVIFMLPVTKHWLEQVALGLMMNCHSSLRGVHEFMRDILDVSMSTGTVFNIYRRAAAKAAPFNQQQDLANVRDAALDELFQGGPVLAGADVHSTYCFLLSNEAHRDADTWAVHLLDLQERHFQPQSTIADFAKCLRAGQALALPGVPCRGDVFHALYELTPVVTYLANRAYEAIETHDKLAGKKAKAQQQGQRAPHLNLQTGQAAQNASKAITLADDIACLLRWLQYDILAVSGMPYADRCQLYDFVVAELKARAALCPHRLDPVCTLLTNQRDHLLAYAAQLDKDLCALATAFQVPVALVREVLDVQKLNERQSQRWQRELALWDQLGDRFWNLQVAVQTLAEAVVRASSVIENLNSRLRGYFFLRREVGPEYLALLQFFLNHRRFLRSEHAERVDKSPAELLTGQTHPHWLEMLGYKRFSRK